MNSTPSPANPVDEKMNYPSMHFVHDKAITLPEEGTATIKFRRTMATHDTSDPQNPVHRHEIEVHGIDVHPSKESDEPMGVNVGKALKDAMRKKMGKGEYAGEE